MIAIIIISMALTACAGYVWRMADEKPSETRPETAVTILARSARRS